MKNKNIKLKRVETIINERISETVTLVKEVRNSTNYNELKRLEGFNREVSNSGVKNLTPSLEKRGFWGVALVIETSIITGKLEQFIIDSQHRLEACRVLGMPYSYMVYRLDKEEDTLDNIIGTITDFNSTAVKWSNIKYLECYAKTGKKEYVIMLDALKSTKLTVTDMQNIYLGGSGAEQVKAFKSGKMKFEDKKDSEKKLLVTMKIHDVIPMSFVKRSFFKVLKLVKGNYMALVDLILADKASIPDSEKKCYPWLLEKCEEIK